MPQLLECLVPHDPVTSSERLNEDIDMFNQTHLSVGLPSKRDRLWLGQWEASLVLSEDSSAI